MWTRLSWKYLCCESINYTMDIYINLCCEIICYMTSSDWFGIFDEDEMGETAGSMWPPASYQLQHSFTESVPLRNQATLQKAHIVLNLCRAQHVHSKGFVGGLCDVMIYVFFP